MKLDRLVLGSADPKGDWSWLGSMPPYVPVHALVHVRKTPQSVASEFESTCPQAVIGG